MFLLATGLTLLYGQQNTAAGGDRVRATYAAISAIEAAHSIRDGSFAGLTAGTHGYALNGAHTWVFSGTSMTVSGGYVTALSASSASTDWVSLTSVVDWQHGIFRAGRVTLKTELTNWRTTRATGDWSGLSLQGTYDAGSNIDFNDIAVSGNYAFVTTETSGGGPGIYIFDISNLASPARVAASASFGRAAYGIVVKGSVFYVLTDDPSAEIRAYSVGTPTVFDASANLLTTYNLSGSALATSLDIEGSTLVVGAQYDATNAELYSFDISSPTAIVARGNLQVAAGVNGVAVSGTGVFLATADTAGEMTEAVLSGTGGLSYPVTPQYNLTSTEVGRSIAVSGTSAVLGRLRGTSIQEMVLLNGKFGGGSPPPSPGPWYHEGSGSVVAVDMDGSRCYAFLAADSSGKAVQVVHLKNSALPESATYNSTYGRARGLFYDLSRDRLLTVTRRAFLIFQPSGSASTCL